MSDHGHCRMTLALALCDIPEAEADRIRRATVTRAWLGKDKDREYAIEFDDHTVVTASACCAWAARAQAAISIPTEESA